MSFFLPPHQTRCAEFPSGRLRSHRIKPERYPALVETGNYTFTSQNPPTSRREASQPLGDVKHPMVLFPKKPISRDSTLAKFSDYSLIIILNLFTNSYETILHLAQALYSTPMMFSFPKKLTFRDPTIAKFSNYFLTTILKTFTKSYTSVLHFAKVLNSTLMRRSKHKTSLYPCSPPQNIAANHAKTRNAAWGNKVPSTSQSPAYTNINPRCQTSSFSHHSPNPKIPTIRFTLTKNNPHKQLQHHYHILFTP